MELLETHKIVAANRLNTGIVIKFDDDSQGFFSQELLYEILPRAEPLDDSIVDW